MPAERLGTRPATPARASGARYPAWAAPVSLALALLGLAVAAYLTYEHFTGSTSLACSETSRVNCLKVTTSSQSMLFGFLPVALAGLLYYAGMVVLTSPPAWRSRVPAVDALRLVGAVAGIAMVGYLVYAEFVLIGAICLWCTAVHVVTFLLFVAVLLAHALRDPDGT